MILINIFSAKLNACSSPAEFILYFEWRALSACSCGGCVWSTGDPRESGGTSTVASRREVEGPQPGSHTTAGATTERQRIPPIPRKVNELFVVSTFDAKVITFW